jgi:hypothetical protein
MCMKDKYKIEASYQLATFQFHSDSKQQRRVLLLFIIRRCLSEWFPLIPSKNHKYCCYKKLLCKEDC